MGEFELLKIFHRIEALWIFVFKVSSKNHLER